MSEQLLSRPVGVRGHGDFAMPYPVSRVSVHAYPPLPAPPHEKMRGQGKGKVELTTTVLRGLLEVRQCTEYHAEQYLPSHIDPYLRVARYCIGECRLDPCRHSSMRPFALSARPLIAAHVQASAGPAESRPLGHIRPCTRTFTDTRLFTLHHTEQ